MLDSQVNNLGVGLLHLPCKIFRAIFVNVLTEPKRGHPAYGACGCSNVLLMLFCPLRSDFTFLSSDCSALSSCFTMASANLLSVVFLMWQGLLLETVLACRREGVRLPRASGESLDFPEFPRKNFPL